MADLSDSDRPTAEMEGGSSGEVPVEYEVEIVEKNGKPNADADADAFQDKEGGGIADHSLNTAGFLFSFFSF